MKVLILAYDFPPLISIGALRPYSWYKYLPEYDIEITVITRHWDTGRNTWQDQISPSAKQRVVVNSTPQRKLIQVPFIPGLKEKMLLALQADIFKKVRQGITFLYSYLEYFGMGMDARSNIYSEAKKELQSEHYNYIIATGRPFILFKYASRLAKEFNIPWIADYRDSWTLNHIQGHYIMGFATSVLNRFYNWKEKKFLANVKWITTVAPSYADVMPPYIAKQNIKIIYNGYDDEVAESLESLQPEKEKFIISYAGTMYFMQRLELFLAGLQLFITQMGLKPHDVEVHFWGLKEDETSVARIENYNVKLKEFIRIHQKVTYSEVMKELSKAHILLLLASGSDDWINAKLFDYLALKRRILMIGNKNNLMTSIIEKNKTGVSLEDVPLIAAYLTESYQLFLSGGNMVTSPLNYQQFSRRSQAYVFSHLLKNG